MASLQSRFFNRLIKEEKQSLVDISGQYYMLSSESRDIYAYKDLEKAKEHEFTSDNENKILMYVNVNINNSTLWDLNHIQKFGDITDENGLIDYDVLNAIYQQDTIKKMHNNDVLIILDKDNNLSSEDTIEIMGYSLYDVDSETWTDFGNQKQLDYNLKTIYGYE